MTGVNGAVKPPQCSKRQPSTPILLPLDQLQNPYRRKLVSPKKIDELRESLRTKGLLDSLRVSARKVIISGTCRYPLLLELGHTEAMCVVHDEITDETGELIFLDAFDTKSDRHWIDKAFLAAEYQARHQLNWAQTAKALGYSAPTVSRYKSVTSMCQAILDALRSEKIGLMHAMELKRVQPEGRQLELLKETVEKGWSPKELRQAIRGRKGGAKKPERVKVGPVELLIPANVTPAEVVEALKSVLFVSCQKATSLSLGISEIQKLIAGMKPN